MNAQNIMKPKTKCVLTLLPLAMCLLLAQTGFCSGTFVASGVSGGQVVYDSHNQPSSIKPYSDGTNYYSGATAFSSTSLPIGGSAVAQADVPSDTLSASASAPAVASTGDCPWFCQPGIASAQASYSDMIYLNGSFQPGLSWIALRGSLDATFAPAFQCCGAYTRGVFRLEASGSSPGIDWEPVNEALNLHWDFDTRIDVTGSTTSEISFNLGETVSVEAVNSGTAVFNLVPVTEIIVPRGNTVTFATSDLGLRPVVKYVNIAPSFNCGGDISAPADSGAQFISGWANSISAGPPDEADQTLTFLVTSNSNPALFASGPVVSSDGTLSFTPAPGASGSAQITIVLQDNGGTILGGVDTSIPCTFTITVTPANNPPVVVSPIPDQSAQYGASFSFTVPVGTFSDPDSGQTLSYAASGLPPGTAFDGSSRAFSGTPTQAGTFVVTVTATDNGTPPLSVSDSFNIVVAKAIPTLNWPNPADITLGTTLSATQLNAAANVPGSFVYNPPAGSVLGIGNGTILSASFTPTDSANYAGASASASINVYEILPTGFRYERIKSFVNPAGGYLVGGLVQGRNGSLYGATSAGGSQNRGTLFKIDADGSNYLVLHAFTGAGDDGSSPYAGLIQAQDGALYGTTQAGGTGGLGTIFRIQLGGSGFSTVHSFSTASNGVVPSAVLMQGSDGLLYGTTSQGGDNTSSGVLFKLQTDGTRYTVLHRFLGADGRSPTERLLQAPDGTLYGTTGGGGVDDLGTVFKINPDGTGYEILHSFSSSGSDGRYPFGGVIMGSDGVLYGTTDSGGNGGLGTVFQIEPDGSGYALIHSLSSNEGISVYDLIQGSDGALYGTAYGGGAGYGTLFKVNVDGSKARVVYSFSGASGDGQYPQSRLIQGSDQALYGTTTQGGDLGFGTLFRLIPANHAPAVANAIPDQNATYGSTFNYTLPQNTFSDADSAQILTYSVSGLPPGIVFNPTAQMFSGVPTMPGVFTITITVTDDGMPNLSASTSFNLMVSKAALTVTADSFTRVYGQPNPPLTGTLVGVTNGDNITASYSTPAIQTSDTGVYTIYVTLNDPDNRLGNYNVTTTTGALYINPAPQTITFDPIPAHTYGDAPFTVNAAASSGLPVTVSSSAPSVATVSGNTVTIMGIRTTTITASQPGDGNYLPADPVSQTLSVSQGTPVITWSPPAPIYQGTPLSAAQLNATANVPGTFYYTPAARTVLPQGNNQLSVEFDPTDWQHYLTTTATVAINVNSRAPVAVADAYSIDEHTPLRVPSPGLLGNDFDPDQAPGVTFRFSGRINYTDGDADFNLGDVFTGFYTIDPSAAAFDISQFDTSLQNGYNCPFSNWEIQFPGPSYHFAGTATDVSVGNNTAFGDRYIASLDGGASIGTPLPSGRILSLFQMDLQDRLSGGADMLQDASIQTNPVPIGLVQTPGGRFLFRDNTQPQITVDSIWGALRVTAVNGQSANVNSPVTLASGATLLVQSDGSFTYDPTTRTQYLPGGVNDTETFTYQIDDPDGGTATATVTVTVIGVNEPPVAGTIPNQTAQYGTPFTLTLPANTFTDPDPGETLTYSASGLPGWLSFDPSSATFSGTPDAVGTSTITATATDNGAPPLSASTTFNLVVSKTVPTITWPTPAAISHQTPLSVTQLNATANVPGTFVYNPPPGTVLIPGQQTLFVTFTPADSATYVTVSATVVLNVLNQAPVAIGQSLTTPEDKLLSTTLSATDADNDPLTYAIVTSPSYGQLNGTPPNLIYSPSLHWNGTDSFTFKANDGFADSAPATVTLTVTPVNYPPVAQPQWISVNQGGSQSITLSSTDVENDPVTYSVISGPFHGTLTGTPPNLTYTPTGNFVGRDSFVFVADEGNGSTNSATVVINVGLVPVWSSRVGTPQSFLTFTGLAGDRAGDVCVIGSEPGANDFITSKFDTSGVLDWTVNYSAPVNSVAYPGAIATDSAGNVYSADFDSSGGTGVVILKYDANGNLLWQTRNALAANAIEYPPAAVAVDSTGNVVVVSFGSDGVVVSGAHTAKYDSSGNQLWSQWVAGGNPHALALDDSDNIYWAGDDGYGNLLTVKYDPAGSLQFKATYTGNAANVGEKARSLAVDASGNVYVTGMIIFANSDSDYITLKYDATGNLLWAMGYNGDSNGTDVARSVAVDQEGDVLVTGTSYTDQLYNDSIIFSSGDIDTELYGYPARVVTVKYDANGNQLWTRVNFNPSDYSYGQKVTVDRLDQIHVSGNLMRINSNVLELMLEELSAAGDLTWESRTSPLNMSWVQGAGHVVDAGGDVYVAGQSYTRGSSPPPSDIVVAKFVPPSTIPVVTALSPRFATNGSTGVVLTVLGRNLYPNDVVYWNGSARPTSFVNGTQLTAGLLDNDFLGNNNISTAVVTVRNDEGLESGPLIFTLTSPAIGAVQSSSASAGQTAMVSTAPTTPGTAGVAAAANNVADSASVILTAASYSGNPTQAPIFDAGGGYMDLRVVGAGPADTAISYFYYGSTVTGTTEQGLQLLYYNGTAWIPVRSSGNTDPAKDITDNLDNTVSGGRFSVTFDSTSHPSITQLTGTVFTATVAQPPTISSPPQNLSISAGNNATFSVLADGLQPLSYQWQHNGVDVPGATGASLVVNNVQVSDGGGYAVRVTNIIGAVMSPIATLAVSRLTPVITWASPAGIVYGTPLNGTQLNATANVPGSFVFSPAAGTVLLHGNSQTLAVTFTPADPGRYTGAAASVTINVSKAPLTVRADNLTKGYGAALPTLTASYVGFVNGDTAANLTAQPVLSTTAKATSIVGSYPITVSGAIAANYIISFANGTLTVTPAPLTIKADDKSKVYGKALPTLTVTYSGFVNGDTASKLSTPVTLSTTATASSSVGVYPITPGGATSSNYTLTFVNGNLTVTPVALTITAQNKSKVYGAQLPTFTATYSGFVNGDTVSSLDTPAVFSTTATSASNVGAYPITVSGASGHNYSITFVAGSLTITPASLTITVQNKSKVYGAALPVLTASYSGFVNGDTVASLSTPVILQTTATQTSVVGTYPITASGATDLNYTIRFVNGTLTVTKAALTVTAISTSKVYGAPMPSLTYTVTGFVLGESQANLATPVVITTTATASSKVSNYPITVNGATATNYTITFQNGTLTVTRAPLTITADNKTKKQGTPNPAFTATYSGFVNGDTVASLSTPVSFSTTATTSSPVGTYPITPKGATSLNYTITFVNGTLTVTP